MADLAVISRTDELPISRLSPSSRASTDIVALHFVQADITNALSYMTVVLAKDPQEFVKAVNFGDVVYKRTLADLPLPIEATILANINSLLSIAHKSCNQG